MSTVVRIDPGPRMSEASVFGDRMYLSGMIPEDTAQNITGQVKQALGEIDSLLAKGGSDNANQSGDGHPNQPISILSVSVKKG